MDKFKISGGRALSGTVIADGSKNAALPILVGGLMIAEGDTVIRNVPPLRDIHTIIKVLRYLGASVEYDVDAQTVTINAKMLSQNTAPYELMRQMRASFLVFGPILSRLGEARVSLPGGCVLGARPVNYHVKAFSDMGAEVKEEAGYIVASAKRLNGGSIYFDRPSHTGTENVLYGAVLAGGVTHISNAACDPEVIDVANFLNKAGAKIHGAGTPTITVEPVERLHAVEYEVSGDRLVAGTFMLGAAITGGDVEVRGVDPAHLTLLNHKLRESGCTLDVTSKSIRVKGPRRPNALAVTTFPYPGFPTDLQACIMSVACVASGTSRIRETVFEDRFSHVMELNRLGADVTVAGDEAIINGVKSLQGTSVMASDIRAGAGLVLACLAAHGDSEVLRVYHVDRGYDRLDDKLASLGADIQRIGE